MNLKERYRATLLGCAVGDTLGMPVEGWKANQIKKHFGKITEPFKPRFILNEKGERLDSDEFGKLKYYCDGLNAGDYTDDTILTLAIAESLIEKGMDLKDSANRQLREYEKGQEATGFKGGFGGTTVEAFKNLQLGIAPEKSGVIGGPGNANAMKMSPLGLYMFSKGRYYEGIKYAKAISKTTHLDPRSVASGVLQASAIYQALANITRWDFIQVLINLCKETEEPVDDKFKHHEDGSLLSRLMWIKDNKDVSDNEAHEYLGSSSKVYQSYPFALFMFQKYWDKPLEGLIETVNYGGDCDTTGAIYGSLAGAKNGIFFPNEWMANLKDNKRIIALADKLYGC